MTHSRYTLDTPLSHRYGPRMRLIGPLIAELRKERGWTSYRLGQESHTSRATVVRAERGESVFPSTAARIALALSTPARRITPGDLWADRPADSPAAAAPSAPGTPPPSLEPAPSAREAGAADAGVEVVGA